MSWTLARGVAAGLLLALGILCAFSSGAHAVEQWYVEIREPGIAESQVRRAIAIELRELSIAADPTRQDDDSTQVSLYIRVERIEGLLMVALWDRGEFVGRRRISDTTHSTILARRVGLAVGELGSRLNHNRARQARVLAQQEALARQRAEEEARLRQWRALRLRAGLTSQFLPRGAWNLGPMIGLVWTDRAPLALSMDLSWSAGGLPSMSEASLGGTTPQWSQFEFSLGADYLHRASPRTTLSLGPLIAVSTVNVGGAAFVDGIPGQKDTWSARAGLRFGSIRSWGDTFEARVDLSGGAVLRPVPVSLAGEEFRVGGGFVGVSLSVLLRPLLSPKSSTEASD